MEQMVYEANITEHKILHKGTYKGFNYLVVSYGTHPCCYVEIPETHKMYKKEYDTDEGLAIDCHGGLTFADFRIFPEQPQAYYIGWDYAHYTDFNGVYLHEMFQKFARSGKKWATEELIKDCEEVIDQL